MTIKTEFTAAPILRATNRAIFQNLGHAAASIRQDAIASIEQSSEASQPGTPPHTRRGQLQKSILYALEGDEAIVGPAFSIVGESGAAHEFGGEYKGTQFVERAFMGPALEANLDRFASQWAGSITN